MPLIRFDLIEGRDEQSVRMLLDAAHQAMVQALAEGYEGLRMRA